MLSTLSGKRERREREIEKDTFGPNTQKRSVSASLSRSLSIKQMHDCDDALFRDDAKSVIFTVLYI